MVPIAIVVIALAFLAVDTIIQHIQARRGEQVYGFFMPDPPMETASVPPNFSRMAAVLDDFGIRPPSNVFLHRGHTWAAVEDSGAARVGVDSFARKAIGHIDAIELPEVGQTVRQGERLFAYRQGNRVAEFVAPIDGTVTHLNEKASSRDGQAVADWICRIKPRNLSGNLDVLTIAEDAVKWVYQELLRLQEMVAMQIPRLQTVGVTMQDGPLALDNLLESFDDETWNTFQNKFLTRHTGSLEEK